MGIGKLLRFLGAQLFARSPEAGAARVGKLALASNAEWATARRDVIEARLPRHDWPTSDLRLVVVDAVTGAARVIDPRRRSAPRGCRRGELRDPAGLASGHPGRPRLHRRRNAHGRQPRPGAGRGAGHRAGADDPRLDTMGTDGCAAIPPATWPPRRDHFPVEGGEGGSGQQLSEQGRRSGGGRGRLRAGRRGGRTSAGGPSPDSTTRQTAQESGVQSPDATSSRGTMRRSGCSSCHACRSSASKVSVSRPPVTP